MIPTDFSDIILRTAHQVDHLKQIEAADPKEQRRLRHQLKELQTIQIWQLNQEGAATVENIRPVCEPLERPGFSLV